jgi:hypothetical protein
VLAKRVPATLETPANDGMLPLHVAARYAELDVVHALARMSPCVVFAGRPQPSLPWWTAELGRRVPNTPFALREVESQLCPTISRFTCSNPCACV